VANVRNLIFDLGGVILNLRVDDTVKAFAALANIPVDKAKNIFAHTPEFNLYEKGMMSDNDFREFLRSAYALRVDDATIDTAWNAMLKDLPPSRLALLERLKNQYQVFLLSNTNDIHLHHINEVILPAVTGGRNLDVHFHRAYYSHRMKMRKPDGEIFEQVLKENDLRPAETLFLDDNIHNVEGAQSTGIQGVHVNTDNFILDYFA